MSKIAIAWLVLGFLLAVRDDPRAVAAAQENPATEATTLANTLTQAFVRGDSATAERVLADDLIAIFGDGGPQTKADQLKRLAQLKCERAALEDVSAVAIRPDVVAVSYRLVRQCTFKGKAMPPEAYVLAVWAKRSGKWQQVTYQETLPVQP
jgi:hypothetical protein